MARKKVVAPKKEGPVQEAVEKALKLEEVGIIPAMRGVEDDVPTPASFAAQAWHEAPSALTPTVDWTTPGQFIAGKLVTIRQGVGPNASRLYVLMVERHGPVSVWGCTILDSKFDLADIQEGSLVMIQYLGTVKTSRGLNPAKNFRVMWK